LWSQQAILKALELKQGPGYNIWLQKHLKQFKVMEVQIREFQWPVAVEA
jgi:hypothetical protein